MPPPGTPLAAAENIHGRINVLVSSLSGMQQLAKVHATVTKSGLFFYPSILAKLVSAAALYRWGDLAYARSLFDSIPFPSPFFFNLMIRAYSLSPFPILSLHLYNRMSAAALSPDHFTFPFALKATGRLHDTIPASHKGAEIHCRIFHLGFQWNQYIQNSLLHMYCGFGQMSHAHQVFDEMSHRTVVTWNTLMAGFDHCGDHDSAEYLFNYMPQRSVVTWNCAIWRHFKKGDIVSAGKVFEEMPEKDGVSWNSMIAGYVGVGDYKRAMEMFAKMQDLNVEPTELTIVSVLGACAETGALDLGIGLHEYLHNMELRIDGFVGNALVDMYAKCGCLDAARKVFDGLALKHVTCWNAMIVGLAVHGYCKEALDLFSLMENESNQDCSPDRVTFLGILTACSHNGLLKHGQKFFRRMIEEYGIEPDMKHYGCMVHLFSRCGLLDEAYRFIKEMPGKANTVMWKTLLSACRIHGAVDLAERIFRELAELNLVGDEEYILMSNIYAEAKRWKDVERLRTATAGCSILKPLGCSQLKLG